MYVMNKAIIVLDMPEHCDYCHFGYYSDGRILRCQYSDKTIEDIKAKPEWCPLKPLPEKYEIDKNKCSDPFYEFEFEHGYNQCIDEILGD